MDETFDTNVIRNISEIFSLPKLREIREISSRLRYLKSLRELCLESILKNFSIFCDAESEPFEKLPRRYMTELIKKLEERHSLTADTLSYTIGYNTEVLSLSKKQFGIHSDLLIDSILLKAKEKSKNSLVYLDLVRVSPTPEVCLDVLSSLRNLTELNLSISKIDDETLAVIGANLENLRKLSFEDYDRVSNRGLENLCIDDGHGVGKCKKLTHLSMQKSKGINKYGLITALLNFPRLQSLEHIKTEKALINLIYMPKNYELQLNCLNVTDKSIPYFAALLSMCPNIQHFSYQSKNFDVNNMLCLMKDLPSSQLVSLSIHLQGYQTAFDFNVFCSILKYNKNSLENLKMIGCRPSEPIEIGFVGMICPNLITLVLRKCNLTYSLQYTLNDSFKFLQYLELSKFHSIFYSFDSTLELNHKLLCKDISKLKQLRELHLCHFEFNALICFSQAATNENMDKTFFPQLEKATLIECLYLNLDSLVQFICHSPCLDYLKIEDTFGIDGNVIDCLKTLIDLWKLPVVLELVPFEDVWETSLCIG